MWTLNAQVLSVLLMEIDEIFNDFFFRQLNKDIELDEMCAKMSDIK